MNCAVSGKLLANYDSYYDAESEWRRLGAVDKAANIVEMCGDHPHRTILEIGSGEGAILGRLSSLKFGDSLFALEISRTGVETTRKRAIPQLVDCKLFDGCSIPYPDGQFDLAILSHVVEHLEHPRTIIYEAIRVAKVVFVEVPLEDTMRMTRDYVFDAVGHINFYSPKTIRRLLQTCDLEVLKQRITCGSRPSYQYRLGPVRGLLTHCVKGSLLRCSQFVATRLFTYNCSVLCSKAQANSSIAAH
jgi:ubiquinone/menaquinone biosynthesis C-methylase UbiE